MTTINPNTMTAAELERIADLKAREGWPAGQFSASSRDLTPARIEGEAPRGWKISTPDAPDAKPTPPGLSGDAHGFTFDAALPATPPIWNFRLAELSPFDVTRRNWLAQIAAEAHHDFTLSVTALSMRHTDGALTRGGPGGLAYTPHGFLQLVGLMLDSKPANLAACLRWIRPARRASVFVDDVKGRSSRKADDLMVLRTYAAPRPGDGMSATVRTVRAVVSQRHSQASLDDAALSAALAAELPDNAPSAVIRDVDRTEGVAEVARSKHLVRTLHWTNSETGCASLSFSAGARITFVDALVRLGSKYADTVTATLVSDMAATRMRHTAPGGKKTPEKQAEIASERMRDRIRGVIEKGEAVDALWSKALRSFPAAFERNGMPALAIEDAAAVLADLVEEKDGFSGDDRAQFIDLLTNDARLGGSADLPRFSAAHVAAAFAVLGARAETMDEAKRYQEIAGRWLTRGW